MSPINDGRRVYTTAVTEAMVPSVIGDLQSKNSLAQLENSRAQRSQNWRSASAAMESSTPSPGSRLSRQVRPNASIPSFQDVLTRPDARNKANFNVNRRRTSESMLVDAPAAYTQALFPTPTKPSYTFDLFGSPMKTPSFKTPSAKTPTSVRSSESLSTDLKKAKTLPKNFDKPVTCFYWLNSGRCSKSDEECWYAHYWTGIAAEAPITCKDGSIAGRQAERHLALVAREEELKAKEHEVENLRQSLENIQLQVQERENELASYKQRLDERETRVRQQEKTIEQRSLETSSARQLYQWFDKADQTIDTTRHKLSQHKFQLTGDYNQALVDYSIEDLEHLKYNLRQIHSPNVYTHDVPSYGYHSPNSFAQQTFDLAPLSHRASSRTLARKDSFYD